MQKHSPNNRCACAHAKKKNRHLLNWTLPPYHVLSPYIWCVSRRDRSCEHLDKMESQLPLAP